MVTGTNKIQKLCRWFEKKTMVNWRLSYKCSETSAWNGVQNWKTGKAGCPQKKTSFFNQKMRDKKSQKYLSTLEID